MGVSAALQLVEENGSEGLHSPTHKTPHQVAAGMRDNGVIVRPLPSIGALAISPPLAMTRGEVDGLVQALTDTIGNLTAS